MKDFKSVVSEVKLAYNIVDYAQLSGLSLKPSGSNRWKGLCFHHNEKSSSLIFDENFQNFRCFGCGISGDIIAFVQLYEHLDFYNALKKLAEDKNIEIDFENKDSGVDYSSLREAMRSVSNYFVKEYRALDREHPARQEVISRGLSEKKMLYGYAPEAKKSLYSFLKKEGFSDEVILNTGACFKSSKTDTILDFWNGRLMFFITDVSGKPIGWSGRKLYETDTRGKYINSRDGILFDKSASLYNFSNAREKASNDGVMYIAEGQFDVAALVEAGAVNSVASSGTAFTLKQGMMIRRIIGEDGQMVFCFDGDEAGRKAAEKVFRNIPIIQGQSYVVVFPDNMDPCDYRLKNSDEKLLELVENSRVPLVEFVLNMAREGLDLNDEMISANYVSQAARILKTVSNVTLQEKYKRRVALDAFVGVDVVGEAIEKAEPLSTEKPLQQEVVSVEVERPVVSETDAEATSLIIEKINKDRFYNLVARMFFLAMIDRNIKPQLEKVSVLFPKSLVNFSEEISKLPNDAPVLPENFENSVLASFIIESNFFPFVHLMDEKTNRDLFMNLFKELRKIVGNRRDTAVRSKVMEFLVKGPRNSSDFFKKALETEERGFAERSFEENIDIIW